MYMPGGVPYPPPPFSTHLLELTWWAFTLRTKPFDIIEVDIEEGGVLYGTKIEEG